MDMDIHILIEISLKAEYLRPRPDIRHGRLRRFLHDLTQFAGDGQFPFTRKNGNLDVQ